MKNSYHLGKYDLPHIRHLFICHPLSGLKNFTASKHFNSFSTFNRDIPLTVDILMMCGMVEFGNHLIEITVKTVFLRIYIMLLLL